MRRWSAAMAKRIRGAIGGIICNTQWRHNKKAVALSNDRSSGNQDSNRGQFPDAQRHDPLDYSSRFITEDFLVGQPGFEPGTPSPPD